jgi:hypothetical protein
VSPVKYELGFYIPEDGILHSHCRKNLKSYIALTVRAMYRRRNVSPVKYELGFYIPYDGILHSQFRENLKSYNIKFRLRYDRWVCTGLIWRTSGASRGLL